MKSKSLRRGLARINSLDQSRLNISSRSRTSRLPWRGQFSPELVEYLLESLCPDCELMLDPFCGSGTVLFESIHRDASAIGAEINPAAWHMASLTAFSALSDVRRKNVLAQLGQLITANNGEGLFSENSGDLIDLAKRDWGDPFLSKAIAAAIILGMGNSAELTSTKLAAGCFAVLNLLKDLNGRQRAADCYLSDARKLCLENASVDGAITSPPYINVFNYHQNYRPAVELLGWKPLEAAQSEIGANRKFRGNRFLTVVQYCIDMQRCFAETSRVLKNGAPFIIVLGRTSNVLGTPFLNGRIVHELFNAFGHFEIEQVAERVFTSRFGEQIFEDIIVARKISAGPADDELARQIGISALRAGLKVVPNKNRSDLIEAIEKGEGVTGSSLLNLTIPEAFKISA